MKIIIQELTKKDIGRWVVYKPNLENERGKIKSWNDTYIFVVYKCANNWDRFQDYTGQATSSRDLEWML